MSSVDGPVCNASFAADPDVAGVGVLISFNIIAWLTILVAIIPATASLRATIHTFRNGPSTTTTISPFTSRLVLASGVILTHLCDLQILTGLSILIAGFSTLHRASYYHQRIIANLWVLTLASFWVARIELERPNTFQSSRLPNWYAVSDVPSTRDLIRRSAVFLSVTIGIAYVGIVHMNQWAGWDVNGAGKCVVNHDHTAIWPWFAAICLYALALLMTLTPWTRPWVLVWLKFLHNTVRGLQDVFRGSFVKPCSSYSFSRRPGAFLCQIMLHAFQVAGSGLALVLFWSLMQLMAFISFGDGYYPLLLAASTGFMAWNTYDIIDLKNSNAHLIVGDESTWGFGQVLPMLLTSSIGFQTIDAWTAADAKPCCCQDVTRKRHSV